MQCQPQKWKDTLSFGDLSLMHFNQRYSLAVLRSFVPQVMIYGQDQFQGMGNYYTNANSFPARQCPLHSSDYLSSLPCMFYTKLASTRDLIQAFNHKQGALEIKSHNLLPFLYSPLETLWCSFRILNCRKFNLELYLCDCYLPTNCFCC